MAYNNKKKGKRSNYFSRNIDRFGENFLSIKTPADLYRDAAQIFRDFAQGNIDIPDYEKYFKDTQFISLLIQQAYIKWEFHNISSLAVQAMMINPQMMQALAVQAMMNNPQIIQAYPLDLNKVTGVLNSHSSSASAYMIIYNFLTEFVNVGDIQRLTVMCGQLRSYREYI